MPSNERPRVNVAAIGALMAPINAIAATVAAHGCRLEHDRRVPPLAVETEIDGIRRVAGEIIVECDRQQEPDPICTEISHRKAVKQGGPPNEYRPRYMQQVLPQQDMLVVRSPDL
jgi:hypothetical protein